MRNENINNITINNINLIVPFFVDLNESRNEELKFCLQKNIDNSKINKIILLCDSKIDESILRNYNGKVLIEYTNKRQTYLDAVNISNKYCMSDYDVSILCNADIYFDESSIEFIRISNLNEYIFALSRWDIKEDGTSTHFDWEWSNDAWIWVGKLSIDSNEEHNKLKIDFPFGIPGCDNRFSYELNKRKFVVNPSTHIKPYHLHITNIRNYKDSDRLPNDGYMTVPVEGIQKYLNSKKNLFIISAYPSSERRCEILKECITNLKKINYDILIISHFPIKPEIQSMVNYYIYDHNNTFLPGKSTTFSYNRTEGFEVEIYNGGHSLPISRNMFFGLTFAKSLNYDFFYFGEFDNIFSENDLEYLNELRIEMFSKEKKLIFFKPSSYEICGSNVYETLLFGGSPSYFLEKFIPPKNIEEWFSSQMGYTLELSFYEKLSKFEDEFLILNDFSQNILLNSKINIFRCDSFICEMVYNETNPDDFVLYLENVNYSSNTAKATIKINGNIIEDRVFCIGCWYFNFFKLNGDIISVDIFLENEYDKTKTFILTEEHIENYKNRGLIRFK